MATNPYGYVLVSFPMGADVPEGVCKVEGGRHVARFPHAATAQAASAALVEGVFEAAVRHLVPEGGPHP